MAMMWQADTIELLRSAAIVAVPDIAADGTRSGGKSPSERQLRH
jgi:hypothetical protein